MKKILVSAYDHKNFGDDLFLKILFDKYKDIEWVLETSVKQYGDIFSKYNNVKIEFNIFYRILRKLKLLKILRNRRYFDRYDALIFIGGSIFMQLQHLRKNRTSHYHPIQYGEILPLVRISLLSTSRAI